MEILARVGILFLCAACCVAGGIHSLHSAKLGRLDCNLCHVPAAKGSVELRRPGHDQCKLCHADAFEKATRSVICSECHSSPTTASAADVLPFPKHADGRGMLSRFSHLLHVDAKSRADSFTGFRADCIYCHRMDKTVARASIPGHTECAGCHSKPDVKPELTPFLRTAGCRGCHAPEELERAAATPPDYPNIRFSHAAHFRARSEFRQDCTTCHSAVTHSAALRDQPLPRMVTCATCHQTSKKIPAQLRIANCQACHLDAQVSSTLPSNFNRDIKPAFHTEAFRVNHAAAAAAPDAKCFACHQNVVPAGGSQCTSCHLIIRPVSHTARWKDDIHGKYAALDRQVCATCHATDYCSRCHNELPNSHVPLPVFKNGGHANLAMLNERSCLTCHTFQNTCSSCHVQTLLPGVKKR